jgi:hypothetical protein
MLKSILRYASLMTLAVIGFSSVPAFANSNTCESSCPRTRACEYRAKELTLTEPTPLTPTQDPPVQLVDPPAFTTPMSPVPTPVVPRNPGRPPRGRG